MLSSGVPLPRSLNFSDAMYVSFWRSSSARIDSTPTAAGPCAEPGRTRQMMRTDRNVEVILNGLRSRTIRTVPDSRILDPMQNLFGRIHSFQNIEILGGDHLFTQQRTSHPIQQSLPVISPDENHGERLNLTCLDQRNRFEQFVECAESARQDDERDRVFHEHYFPHEEIAEVQQLVCINVRLLLERQFDIQPYRRRSGFGRALVRRFHHAWSTAGNHRVTIPPKECRDRLSSVVRDRTRNLTR